MVVYNSDRNSDDLTSLADKYKIWLSAGTEAETRISFRKIDGIYLISIFQQIEIWWKSLFQIYKLKFPFWKCNSNGYLNDQENFYSKMSFKSIIPNASLIYNKKYDLF